MGCVATCRDDVVRYVGDDVVSNQLAEMFASDLAQLVAPMLASIAARDEFDGAKRDLVGNKQSRGVIRVEDVERVEKACERHLDGLIDAVGSMLDGYAMLHGEELKQADCKDLREVIVGAHLYTQVPTKDQTRAEGPAGSGTPAKK